MKILLISCFYPPQNTIASQRPYAWAKYWTRAGDEVTVLTPTKDQSRPDLTPRPLEGVTLLEVEPSRLFSQLRRLFKKSNSAQPASHAVSRPPAPGFRSSRVLAFFIGRGLFSSTRMPDPFDLWIGPATRAIKSRKFDVIVSTFGPYAPLIVAWIHKRRNPEALWVCDFRDLWVRNHVYSGIPGFRWLERRLETMILERCDFAVTVSEVLAQQLKSDHPKLLVRVIQNGFDTEDSLAIDLSRAYPNDGKKRILYTGSLHFPTRNPAPLFEAIARLSAGERAQLEMIFVGPNSHLLGEMVKKFGVQSSVQLRPSVGRFEALKLQRDADVLLFIEATYGASKDGVLTGKIFEYLFSGTPIWAIGIERDSAAGDLIRGSDASDVFGSRVDDIEIALRKLIRDGIVKSKILPDKLSAFTRKAQANRLRELMLNRV
jgi:glycosyltransferase involved in cell wall biosynthesis